MFEMRETNGASKISFLIHFGDLNLVTFGLTSRYCSKCEFIILHKKDVDEEFLYRFGKVADDLFVIGTVDRKTWKKGLEGNPPNFQEIVENLADFKEVLDYEMQPAGWYFEG
jgi:hypothetical protein